VSKFVRMAGVTGFTGGMTLPVSRASLLNAGSLVSVEPSGWGSVPATSTPVTNLASVQCDALVGADAGVLTFINEFTTPEGIVELSTKGGLHVIKKQAAGQTVARFIRISMSSALRTYLATNITHDLYLSWWGKRTRVGLSGSVLRYIAKVSGTATAQFAAGVGVDPISAPGYASPGVGAYRLGFTDHHDSDQYFLAVGSTGASSDFGGTTHANVFLDGMLTTGELAKSPSFLTWALYLEDLTVSGNTFAAVEAIDKALYTAMVETAGGVYYGDTYTDPATV